MADNATTAPTRRLKDFEPTPEGLAERWEQELAAADEAVEDWHDRAKKIEDRYQDVRHSDNKGNAKLNLFHSDVETNKALVYDNEPKVHARRRYADADDDVARVSAEIIERHLNADIEREDDGFAQALEMARDDRLVVGFGLLRLRYVVEWGDEEPEQPAKMGECPECEGKGHAFQAADAPYPGTQYNPMCERCQGLGTTEVAPPVAARKPKTFEDVETDHVVWEDVRWSPCRNKNELRWIAFAAELTLDETEERFPNVNVEDLPVSQRREDVAPENRDTWARVKVWEIWDKTTKTVYWHVRGHNAILDSKPDPLELPGFFPCPRPMMANTTSRKYMPHPDFLLAQDLYDEVDRITDRISSLVEFAKVVGACDKGNDGLQNLLKSAKEGQIIPVENFRALVGENMASSIWMFPLEPIVNAINALVAKRQETIQQLYQVTGNSDIMRGGAQTKTATQARMEGRYGASRTRSRQKELARFAQDAQRIRAQIIARWFDPETIIQRSNIEAAETIEIQPTPPMPQMPPPPGIPPGVPAPPVPGIPMPPPQAPKKVPNRQLIEQAVELLKSDISQYKIEIAEDSLAMTDYDAVQQERTLLIQSLGGFFQAMMPIMADPQSRPYVMRLAQWLIAGMRGASQAESILDEAVRMAEKAAAMPKPPPPPDPKAEAEKVKAGAEVQKAKIGLQQTQMDAQAHAQETAMNMAEARQSFGMRMAEAKSKALMAAETGLPVPPGTPA